MIEPLDQVQPSFWAVQSWTVATRPLWRSAPAGGRLVPEAEGDTMSDAWAYYDRKGNRVSKEHAVFAGKEIAVETGVPAPPSHANLHGVEYHEVHLLKTPDVRQHFRSRSQMLRWFEDVTSTDG
jgi:hypothetical protein